MDFKDIMAGDYTQFEQRKQDHIELALMHENQAVEVHGFDAIDLVHEALPDLDFADLDLRTTRLGRLVKVPFIVASMTAGHQNGVMINEHLMAACQQTGWAMGVGSQRRELSDKSASLEWHLLRKKYPDVSMFSNIGIAQVITALPQHIQQLTEALHAEGLIVHCNPLQECIQPEGTPQFKGSLKALEILVKKLTVPVIVKETGCGFSKNTLSRLNDIGVKAVDVSGLGGTHWGRIEGQRATGVKQRVSTTFRNWGIDTVCSVRFAKELNPAFEVWGSGGVRHGLDAAKLLALGASSVAFAKPMLEAAVHSCEQVIETMNLIEYELKVAMFCTGSQKVNDLKEKLRC